MYVLSHTLLLSDVFKSFRNMYFEIYGLYSSKFLSATGLALQVALKNTKIKFDHLNDVDVILKVEKGIRREYVTLFIDMQKLTTNT